MNTVWIILAVEMDPSSRTEEETKKEKLELDKVKTHKEFICVEGMICEGNQIKIE